MKTLERCCRQLSRIKLILSLFRLGAGTYRLFDREDQFWRHSLNLDGAADGDCEQLSVGYSESL